MGKKGKSNALWSDKTFAQAIDAHDIDEKLKTFHEKSDEKPFVCRKCKVSISGHNKDWHEGMCDDCFNKEFFPEDQTMYEKRLLVIKGNAVDPDGFEQSDFERELDLTTYIETEYARPHTLHADAFLLFLEKAGVSELTAYQLYADKVVEVFDMTFDEIKENLRLQGKNKGAFCSADEEISQAITDKKTFYAMVLQGNIAFSGNNKTSAAMKEALAAKGVLCSTEDVADYRRT